MEESPTTPRKPEGFWARSFDAGFWILVTPVLAIFWLLGTPLGLLMLVGLAGIVVGLLVALIGGWMHGVVAAIVIYALFAAFWLSPPSVEDYSQYVEHPRYGRQPRLTGLDPNPISPEVHLPWRLFGGVEVIQGTAIAADLARQTPANYPITHYFDLKKTCEDCQRPFIFFAEEQKHWFEELGLPLEANCVRCPICRKKRQSLELAQRHYEELCQVAERTTEQNLEMADCCLTLIEQGRFSKRKTERVRMLLNRIPKDGQNGATCDALRLRLGKIEANASRDASVRS